MLSCEHVFRGESLADMVVGNSCGVYMQLGSNLGPGQQNEVEQAPDVRGNSDGRYNFQQSAAVFGARFSFLTPAVADALVQLLDARPGSQGPHKYWHDLIFPLSSTYQS